jgi:hypothetical protein
MMDLSDRSHHQLSGALDCSGSTSNCRHSRNPSTVRSHILLLDAVDGAG